MLSWQFLSFDVEGIGAVFIGWCVCEREKLGGSAGVLTVCEGCRRSLSRPAKWARLRSEEWTDGGGTDGEERFGSGHSSVKLLFCDLKHE